MGQPIFLQLISTNAVLGIPLAWGCNCHLATKDVFIILTDHRSKSKTSLGYLHKESLSGTTIVYVYMCMCVCILFSQWLQNKRLLKYFQDMVLNICKNSDNCVQILTCEYLWGRSVQLPTSVVLLKYLYKIIKKKRKCKRGWWDDVMNFCSIPVLKKNDSYKNLLPFSSMCLKFKVNVKNQIAIGRRQEIYMFQLIYACT